VRGMGALTWLRSQIGVQHDFFLRFVSLPGLSGVPVAHTLEKQVRKT